MRLAELDMVTPRAELWDGEVIEMSPVNNPHSICRSSLNRLLLRGWQPPRFIRSQDTHRFPGGWLPQPDIALLPELPTGGAEDVDPPPQLVVEIMLSSRDLDLNRKRLRYAQHGVPEYWVVDLTRDVIHVFREPILDAINADAAWRRLDLVHRGGSLSPACAPELTLSVDDILPPR